MQEHFRVDAFKGRYINAPSYCIIRFPSSSHKISNGDGGGGGGGDGDDNDDINDKR